MHYNLALERCELLGSRLVSFITVQEGLYIIARRPFGPRAVLQVVKQKGNIRHYWNSIFRVGQLVAYSVDGLRELLQDI